MALRLLNHAEQVAAHLRAEIEAGRWIGNLPGVGALAEETGVNHTTINAAMQLLEEQGLVVNRGSGKARRVAVDRAKSSKSMRIALLDHDVLAAKDGFLAELSARLKAKGFTVELSRKTLTELKMDPRRIARMVGETEADAWVVLSAPRQVLKWFANKRIPVMAIFGQFDHMPIAAAAVDYQEPIRALQQRLVDLGHRRIVYLSFRGQHRQPIGSLWQTLFDDLESQGIATGAYNLPTWEDCPEGFQRLLESLFDKTPPTALVIEEVPHYIAVLNFCMQRGLKVPDDLSLACLDYQNLLDHCLPPVAHITWRHAPVIQQVVRWADMLSRGKSEPSQHYTTAEFIDGPTIGHSRSFH